jgi:hypothetical protein
MKKKERTKDRSSEREYHDRLKRLLKSGFNTQLKPLRALKTATRKRRELKKKPPGPSKTANSETAVSGG